MLVIMQTRVAQAAFREMCRLKQAGSTLGTEIPRGPLVERSVSELAAP